MSIDSTSTIEQIKSEMKAKLGKLIPDFEITYKAELVQKINKLKKERGAIILGHNYMEPAIYFTVADYVGDSLELSRLAAKTDADPIIFCGVRFMAETAKILNPSKKVLLPAKVAGCSLAASITANDVKELKRKFPGVPVVTYINTYADVKAEVDICCTSGNAHKVVNSLNSKQVIFLPDQYLAGNVANETGRKLILPDKNGDYPEFNKEEAVLIGWNGKCEVHDRFTVDDITNVRRQFPGTVVITHPECSPEVVAASDIASSTSKMLKYVKETKAPHFLILTECSMADNIIAENPDKDVLRLCSIRCPHMNEITLEDTLNALENDEQEISLPAELMDRARGSLQRMLEI